MDKNPALQGQVSNDPSSIQVGAPDAFATSVAQDNPSLQMGEDVGEESDKKNPVAEELEDITDDGMSFLARKTQEEFTRYKGARFIQEQIWVEAHQNFKGVYPSDMDFQNGTSRAFVQITRPKVVTALATIAPIILPPGDKCFTVDPTPNPYMPKLAHDLITKGMAQDEIRKEILKQAHERAEAMENRVDDGLAETGFSSKFLRFGLDMCLYGTGIMMGPFAKPVEKKHYDKQSIWQKVKSLLTGAYDKLAKMGLEEEWSPELEVISPFDFYPDPAARTVEECESVIVRKVMGKSDVRKLRKREGFNKNEIDEALKATPNGNWIMEGSWEGVINSTNSQYQMNSPSDRYVVLVRWGWLSGEDLRRAGMKIDDDQVEEQVMVQTWVIGNHVIALLVSDLHKDRIPVYAAPYSLVPHSIWGAGLPEMMRDSQSAVNAYERMKLDNAAICGGPQFIVDIGRIVPGETLNVRPRKVWRVKEQESGATTKPIEIMMPECHVGEYQASQDRAMALADEQTCIPRLLMGFGGEGVHNRTEGGASLQFNSALTPMKSVVFNIENHLIIPMVKAMCNFYLEFSKDETIKGDHTIIARGVQGLMAREAISQKIATVLQYVGQQQKWAEQIDLDAVFDLMMRDSGLTDQNIVLPQEVVSQRRQQEAQQQAQIQTQQAAAQAQNQAMIQEKTRAVTDPKDALLELIKDAPEGSKTRLALLGEGVQQWGFQNGEVSQALNDDLQVAHLSAIDAAHSFGANQAERESNPENALKLQKMQEDMAMSREKHAMAMQQAQNQR